MADQPELVGGNQNDQAAQPSATDQNDQRVQLSADKNKKEKKRKADRKHRAQKKQKTEDMLKQIEKLKADCAELETKLAYTNGKLDCVELEKKLAYANGKLDQLKEDMEKTRETIMIQKQTVETQYLMINMLQQQYFSFGMTPDNIPGTEEAGLPVHHPPAFPSGTAMASGDPVIGESLGIHRGYWADENNVEQPALTSDGHRFVSLDQLNSTNPPGTAMASGSSPMHG